jgi:hypothetical protein
MLISLMKDLMLVSDDPSLEIACWQWRSQNFFDEGANY